MPDGERTVEPHLQHAHPLPGTPQEIRGLARGFRRRPHQYNDPLGVGCPLILEQAVGSAGERSKAIHTGLHDLRHSRIVRITGLARLEKGVGIMGRATHHRMFRRQGARPVCAHKVFADHCPDVLIRHQTQVVHFVRGPEAVKEMQEGNPRLERCRLRNQRHVVGLLHRAGGQQRKTGPAGGHDIGMVTKDRQRGGRQCAGRHMKYGRGQLARDLVHVRQHQHQPLGGREGGRHGTRLQRAVNSAGGTALALHFLHHRNAAPKVGHPPGRPLVRQLRHGRGRGDGINRTHFVSAIGNAGNRAVAVQGLGPESVGFVVHYLSSSRTGSGIMLIAWVGQVS